MNSRIPDLLGLCVLGILLGLLASCSTDNGPGTLSPGMPRVPDWVKTERPENVEYGDEELLFVKKPRGSKSMADKLRGRRDLNVGPGGVRLLTKPLDMKGSNALKHRSRDRRTRFDQEASKNKRSIASETGTMMGPRSDLETQFAGGPNKMASRDLLQFGYDFFRRDNQGAAAAPTSSRYIIGPGDELRLRVWGSQEISTSAIVNKEGKVDFPEIGSIPVAGRPYSELRDFIRREYARILKNFECDVSLARLRSIKIFVVGEVASPGLHDVSADATLITALAHAGGPKKSGSLRKIQLRRQQENIVEIDLYRFFREGDRSADVQLVEGDTLHVPSIGDTVAVAGQVVRPGIYEVRKERRLDQVLELAGGLTPFAYQATLQVETSGARGERRLEDVDLETARKSYQLSAGDLIKVAGVDGDVDNVVQLEGNIVRPGDYEWKPGMRISDLCRQSGGFYTDTYFRRATISRTVGEAGSYEHIVDALDGQTNHEVIHVDLEKALDETGSDHDIELAPLDVLTIFSREEVMGLPKVKISGAVRKEGTFEFTTGMRASDLVRLAGNPKRNAFLDQAEIVRRVYEVESTRFNVVHIRFDLQTALRNRARDPLLKNHDEVIVRSSKEAQVRVVITGEVKFAGEYVLPQGARISDLLLAAGGLEDNADLRASMFSRQSVKVTQQERLDDLVRRATREFERAYEAISMSGRPNESQSGQIALKQDQKYMNEIRRLQATGRVIIDLCRNDFPSSTDDLILENADVLKVPKTNNTVMVLGEVFNPAAMIWRKDWALGDYLDQIGGLTEESDEDRLYLVRANGTVLSASQVGYADLMAEKVLPGDSLLVPEAPTERPFMSSLRDIGELALMFGMATQAFKADGAIVQ